MSNYLTDQDLTNIVERTLYADQDDALSMAFEIRTYRAQIRDGWRPSARVIRSMAELDQLQPAADLVEFAACNGGGTPAPAVVRDDCNQTFARYMRSAKWEVENGSHARWQTIGHEDVLDSTNLMFPVTVLAEPAPENGDDR